MKKGPYDDIIHLTHHISQTRPRMPQNDRAAQFSAFAALVGYEDVIDETARLTAPRRELDETEKAELDRKLRDIAERLPEKPVAEIEYFIPDEWKDGGEYMTRTGAIVKISRPAKTLTMEDGLEIDLDDIVGIKLKKKTIRAQKDRKKNYGKEDQTGK